MLFFVQINKIIEAQKKYIFVINGIGVIQDIPQSNFNQIKGIVHEVAEHDEFPSVTLEVGHNTRRFVNFYIKRSYYDTILDMLSIGSKIVVTYFLSSRSKHGRWYTMANVLRIDLA